MSGIASSAVRCVLSVIELGQGTHAALSQIVADRLGVATADVGVVGGGAWASAVAA